MLLMLKIIKVDKTQSFMPQPHIIKFYNKIRNILHIQEKKVTPSLVTFTQYDGKGVRFENDAPCLIKGKDNIKIIEKISCDNAYYVEGLNYNLLMCYIQAMQDVKCNLKTKLPKSMTLIEI